MASNRNSTIYQEIWNADQSGNGLPPILSSDTTTPRDKGKGYVIVNETPEFNKDTKVLEETFIPNDKKNTYDLCEKLLDNYNIDPSNREEVTGEEDREVDAFINAIKGTKPMEVARKFIDPNLTDQEWFKSIKDKWFTMFEKYDRSGFEHVFVGELKKKKKENEKVNKIGGYHFWYKYFLDDGKGQVDGTDSMDYDGPKYGSDKKIISGVKFPEVVTLSHMWNAYETEKTSDDLSKELGGFWVGCSPEGLIALGMARFSGGATTTVINNGKYDVKMFKDSSKKFINTFYPVFKKDARITVVTPVNPAKPTTPVKSTPTEGVVRIIAALVNPSQAPEQGNETVTLKNISNLAVNCNGWRIVDTNRRGFNLSNTLRAGEDKTITLSGLPGTAQLRNSGGKIILEDGSGEVVSEVSYTRGQAKKEDITILF